MKKLPKTFKIILFALVCMVLCGTKAYAASFTLPASGQTRIMDVSGVKAHRGCNVSGSAKAYLTVDDKYNLGRLVVNVESNNTTNSQKVADVVCTYVNTAGKTKVNKVNVTIQGKNQFTSAGTVTKHLAPGESFDVRAESTFDITEIRKFTYTSGSDRGVIDYTCEPGNGMCRIDFLTGVGAQKDYAHVFNIEYKDSSGFLKKGTLRILEVSVMDHPRIYPGGMLVCDWEKAKGDWTYTTAELSNGKDYSFYYSEEKNATLPDCYVTGTAEDYYVFAGWNSAVNDDDVLNFGNKCVSKVNPGSKVAGANAYAPCFTVRPSLKVSVNGGTISDTSWKFYSKDMTYIKSGTKEGEKTYLPTVTFTGTAASSKVSEWVNYTTGETLTVEKAKTTQVELNGDTWIAVIDKVYTQTDLYKTIAVGATETFAVDNMKTCSAPSTTYLSVSNPSVGDCQVKAGDTATPDGVYADVIVTMKDGTKRTYKFSVEDMTGHNQNGNGEFIVDTNPNIIIGQNDETTLNTFYTNQCDQFDITNESFNGALVEFAYSTYYIKNESKNVGLNSSTYKVTSKCGSDKTKYIAFCLDPGRRGPGEYGTDKSAVYVRQDQIDPKTDFGKMIAYIIENEGIAYFNNANEDDPTAKDDDPWKDSVTKRVASHIAIRVSAIKNGYSTAIDTSDLKYATHYYPYAALALKMKDAASNGDVTEAEANDIVDYTSADDWGMTWSTARHKKIRAELVKILYSYDGSKGVVDEVGFERTIDKTNVETINGGKGYKITYTGTITAPSKTTKVNLCGSINANGTGCASTSKTARGVTVKAETFTQKAGTAAGSRLVYDYVITVTANNANAVKVPKTAEEEKEVSLQLLYDGGTTLENAFLATAKNGTSNLQRMIVISTTNPTIFVYFNIVPNNCDLPFLNPANCMSEESCTINEDLFKASGCCRYILDESTYKYVYESVCRVQCTNSTLSSVCNYLPDGSGKADLYTIQEGARWNSSKKKYVESLGACVVNVTDPYVNDGAAKITEASASYKKDDAENTRNVETYERNRYCQVTCEEDWTLGIDAFGNFVGENAVAAGTYFQNIKNDLYIGGKRTCYTTFVNYDRYMANLVDFSEQVVAAYNKYSEWSHAWTDIDRQPDTTVETSTFTDDKVEVKCVEYWNSCPTVSGGASYDYYWSDNGSGKQKCRHVPNAGQTENATCESLDGNDTDKGYYGYMNGDADYTNGGANNDTTKCTFTRYYCDGHGYSDIVTGAGNAINSTGTKCNYTLEKARDSYTANSSTDTKDRPSLPTKSDGTCTGYLAYTSLVSGKCYSSCDTANGYSVKSSDKTKCVKTTYYCNYSTHSLVGTTCYKPCSSHGTGWKQKSGDYTKCTKSVTEDTKESTNLTVSVKYDTTYLRCRTYGHGYSYELNTKNDVEQGSGGKDDLYYGTNPFDKQGLAQVGDKMTQTKTADKNKVKGNYAKKFDHNCVINDAPYKEGGTATVTCTEDTGDFDGGGAVKTDKMYCMKYANVTDKANTFCFAGARATKNNNNGVSTGSSNPDIANAFKDIKKQFKDEAEEKTNGFRSDMMSAHSKIYSHTYDMFYCQNFQLHNQTDTLVSGRRQNPNKRNSGGLYLGAAKDYVKIYTYFDPKAAYTYEEEQFMTILGQDNVIETYIEKNDAAYGGTGSYYKTSNAVKNVKMQTTTGEMTLPLYRNYLENYYYNPSGYWKKGTAQFREYKDSTERGDIGSAKPVGVAKKTITLCTVGVEHVGTGHGYAKEGEVVAFALTQSTPEWLGGYCRDVTVQYKKAHYIKASISNSSFYKNKGYWYIRGGDVKEHGDSLEDAFIKANNRTGSKTNYKYTTAERQRWSLLGSFNVFPVSMATPRNLYQYTYTFGDIGSFSGTKGELGRIMGNDKSIIKDNTRSCFYEVYEEVCLCCGFSMKTDKNTANFVNKNKSKYSYELTNMDKVKNNKGGTIAFYTNSVSLSNIDQGRDAANKATNWSINSPFMYSGDDKLTTDKGYVLQKEIESVGENVYADSPEYAYYLTPDVLAEIRTYNDKYGYEVNFNNLVVYGNTTIVPTNMGSTSCDEDMTSVGGCKWDATEQTINFQHYASKFLAGKVDGTDVDITKYAYGSIKKNANKVCIITDVELSKNIGKGKIADLIEKKGCRWVDYIETSPTSKEMVAGLYEKDSTFTNPTTGEDATIFRLAFK